MKIITADWHLDDTILNEYRWGIFKLIKEVSIELDIHRLYILGDLTERKDKHSSQLINRFIKEISDLHLDCNLEIYILKGNHDYVDENTPFFDFVNLANNDIYFIKEPVLVGGDLFLPHSKELKIPKDLIKYAKCVFMHQPFIGAVAQNNFIMDKGESLETIKNIKAKIFSGDIHTPQQLGKVTYVGSPYHVYWGDAFEGRILLLDSDNSVHEINPGFPKKISATINDMQDLENYKIKPNDQIKIKMILDKSDVGLWKDKTKEIKDYINKIGGVLISLETAVATNKNSVEIKDIESKSDLTILKEYAKKENLDIDYISIGSKIINDNK